MRSIPILLVLLVLVETGYPAILPTEGRLLKTTLDDEAAMPPTEGRLSKTTLDDEAAMPPTEERLSKTTPDDDKLRTLQTSLINERFDEITENMTRLSKRMDDVVSKVTKLERKEKKRSNVDKLMGKKEKKEKKDSPEKKERGKTTFSRLKRPKERLLAHHRKGTLYGKEGQPKGGRGWMMSRANFSRNRKFGSRKTTLIPDKSGERGLGNGKGNRSENMAADVVSKVRTLEGNGKKRSNVEKLMGKKEKKDSPEGKERGRKIFSPLKIPKERLLAHHRKGTLYGKEGQPRGGRGWMMSRANFSRNRKFGSRKTTLIPDKSGERGLRNGKGNRSENMTAGVVSKVRTLEGNGKKRSNVEKLMGKKEKKEKLDSYVMVRPYILRGVLCGLLLCAVVSLGESAPHPYQQDIPSKSKLLTIEDNVEDDDGQQEEIQDQLLRELLETPLSELDSDVLSRGDAVKEAPGAKGDVVKEVPEAKGGVVKEVPGARGGVVKEVPGGRGKAGSMGE
uniref:Uncharacterized protein n=1 Tax=Branchiostoma floridae TaxID=7739 RepID=C3Z4V6_BRAFL|eukprot:XP_002596301.1 hypothetical protein BRAFLDRAFT_82096 [Branchiostoma floridae]